MRTENNSPGAVSSRDELEIAFIATLCPLRERLRRRYDQELNTFGLSRALAAPFMRIWRNDGIRQNALAEQIEIEGPSLVRLLDQLGAMGLVVRRPDPDDQRARTLHLTPAGVELAQRVMPVVERLRRHLLAEASNADLEACLRIFEGFLAGCERDLVVAQA